MKCPECNCEMINKTKSYWGYPCSFGVEPDYPDYYIDEKYKCKNCNIVYNNGKWSIPLILQPSEKQINCISSINYYLNTDYESITKSQSRKIISENIDSSIKEQKDREYYKDLYLQEIGYEDTYSINEDTYSINEDYFHY